MLATDRIAVGDPSYICPVASTCTSHLKRIRGSLSPYASMPPPKKENRFSPVNHPFCRAHGRDKTHRQTNTEILITRLSMVWYPWLCSQLVQVISIISLLPCQMWSRPPPDGTHPPAVTPKALSLVLCSSSCIVHHFSQYSHFLLFPKPSPLWRWHSALSFLPSDSLRLQHRSPSQCYRSNFVLDDCKSSNTELLQDWISAHWC